jgi:dTDP-4-dehydrorhamnose reductase
VSTDYVFDGCKREPYSESDPTGPIQTYGRSKLEGEQAVLQVDPDALIARTSTLYGRACRPRPNYVDAVLQQARDHGRLEVVRTPVASPTYAADLAEALLDLLGCEARGVVHVVNAGACSRLELAAEAVRLAGLAVDVRERAAPPGDLPRPAYSALETRRFERITGRAMRPWPVALADYLGA